MSVIWLCLGMIIFAFGLMIVAAFVDYRERKKLESKWHTLNTIHKRHLR